MGYGNIKRAYVSSIYIVKSNLIQFLTLIICYHFFNTFKMSSGVSKAHPRGGGLIL